MWHLFKELCITEENTTKQLLNSIEGYSDIVVEWRHLASENWKVPEEMNGDNQALLLHVVTTEI